MLILYILSVLSFLALVWAAISITRHIRSTSAAPSATADSTSQDPAPGPTHITLAGARRNPVATRTQSDWANLEKTIAKHDLGNTEYPRAPRRTPPTSSAPKL